MLDCRAGKIFYDADTYRGFENDYQQTVLVDANNEHAEFFPLLINTVEIRLVNEVGDGLIGHVSARGEGSDGGEVKLPSIALTGDEEPALIDDQRSSGIALFEQFPQRIIEVLDILLDNLRQRSHVMRIAAFPG